VTVEFLWNILKQLYVTQEDSNDIFITGSFWTWLLFCTT
jgi:hypothetical protein